MKKIILAAAVSASLLGSGAFASSEQQEAATLLSSIGKAVVITLSVAQSYSTGSGPTTAVNALASLGIKDAKSYGNNNSGAQFTTRAGVKVLCLYTRLNQSITCSGVAKTSK